MCGKPVAGTVALVVGGTPSFRGEFPWLAALFLRRTKSLSFHCGGTLISDKVIVTAAHCLKVSDEVVATTMIVVYLGRNNIEDWSEEGTISPKIKNIALHPDYQRRDSESFEADIAVIVLKQTIEFTKYIRPACLWNFDPDINHIISKTGSVVGWGYDSKYEITSYPNKLEIPIVSESECLRSDDAFIYTTSNRTFCAGKKDGKAPCNGDSGGPFTLKENGRWYLRGIVSISLLDLDTRKCNLRQYVVFTDVVHFIPWINIYL